MGATRRQRIEPNFDEPNAGPRSISIEAEERIVPDRSSDPARAGASKARRAAKPKARRGLFGLGAPRAQAGRGGGSGSGNGRGGSGGEGGGRRRPRRRRGFVGHLVRLCVTLVLFGGLAAASVAGYFAATLPQESWEIPDRPPNVKIVSVEGQLLANRGLTGGKQVSLDEISPYIPQAVIAIEDRRFYDHFGVDPIGIARAFVENMVAGSTVQGGSTLTQQLAKNIFLSPEQSLRRKAQEAILAIWLETKFTKDQILEMYLNRVYFGSGATGVEAAARRYFDKSADAVNLGEAAMMAGLLKAPSRLSPANDPKAARERAEVVLEAMRETGFINQTAYAEAIAQEPANAKSTRSGAENYAADVVMDDIHALIGDVEEDVIVETTIEYELEKRAEEVLRSTIDAARQNVTQGALVAIDGTGAIRTLVGGKDYAESQYNRAVDAKRQPGSSFKPFVYMSALEAGWRPESPIVDEPVRIGNWTPENYGKRYRGRITVAEALQRSINTVAAKLIASVGVDKVIETAHRMGIKSEISKNTSIALGTSEVSLLELTSAFVPLSNGGYEAKPHLVNRITTEDGKLLWERGAEVPPIIVAPEIVGMMNAMMSRVVSAGTGQKAAIDGWEAAGKTGTTQNFKDAWFVGYTGNLTAGVWLGNDNGAEMRQVTGGSMPAQIWHDYMETAHEGLPAIPLPGDYKLGDSAPLTADGGYRQDGYGRDGYGYRQDGYDAGGYGGYDGEERYYSEAGQGPRPPAAIPGGQGNGGQPQPTGGFYDRNPPPGVSVQRRVNGPPEDDRSLFRQIFGG